MQKTSQAVSLKKNNTLKACSFVQTFQAHNCTSQSLNPTPFTHRRTHTHAENGGTWCTVFLRTALIAWERRRVWVMCHVTFFLFFLTTVSKCCGGRVASESMSYVKVWNRSRLSELFARFWRLVWAWLALLAFNLKGCSQECEEHRRTVYFI